MEIKSNDIIQTEWQTVRYFTLILNLLARISEKLKKFAVDEYLDVISHHFCALDFKGEEKYKEMIWSNMVSIIK